jgi:hypothetical protein
MIIKTSFNRIYLKNRFFFMNIKYFCNINDKNLNDSKNEKFRVRFAPSPTGKLHIG